MIVVTFVAKQRQYQSNVSFEVFDLFHHLRYPQSSFCGCKIAVVLCTLPHIRRYG